MNSTVSRISNSSLPISLGIVGITVFITPRIVLPLSNILGTIFNAVSPTFLIAMIIALIYMSLNTVLKLLTSSLVKLHCESFVLKIGLCRNCAKVRCTTSAIVGYTSVLCILFIIMLAWYILVMNGMLHAVMGIFISQ